jgi:hypothetical protein
MKTPTVKSVIQDIEYQEPTISELENDFEILTTEDGLFCFKDSEVEIYWT